MADKLIYELQDIKNDREINLKPENLKKGVTCLGIEGILESGIDTSSSNPITENDVIEGKEGFVNGEKIVGAIKQYDNLWNPFPNLDGQVNGITPVEGSSDYTFRVKATLQSEEGVQQPINGLLKNADNLTVLVLINDIVKRNIGLTADKIKAGETILGITGTYTGEEV